MSPESELLEACIKTRAILSVLKNSLPFMRDGHRQIVIGTIEAAEQILDDTLKKYREIPSGSVTLK